MSGVPTAAERDRAATWLAETFRPEASFDAASFPVSFRYDGRESAALLAGWRAEWGPEAGDTAWSRRALRLTDPGSGLQCRVEVTAFSDFPAVEWVGYFRNTGDADTPILSDIQPL